jgi:hypothetical protein
VKENPWLPNQLRVIASLYDAITLNEIAFPEPLKSPVTGALRRLKLASRFVESDTYDGAV